jgi:pectate lyase
VRKLLKKLKNLKILTEKVKKVTKSWRKTEENRFSDLLKMEEDESASNGKNLLTYDNNHFNLNLLV